MTMALLEAIRSGNREEVVTLLDGDPQAAQAVDENGISALMTALYHRQFELAELVAAARPDLSFFEACALGRVEAVRRRIEQDPSTLDQLSADGFSGLHLAAFFGRVDIARLLLSRGAAVDRPAENSSGVTPLHSAVAGRSPEIVEMLVESGADIEARQQGGYTPLMGAAANGQRRVVEFLLGRGADTAQRSDAGQTARDLAAERGFGDLFAPGTESPA